MECVYRLCLALVLVSTIWPTYGIDPEAIAKDIKHISIQDGVPAAAQRGYTDCAGYTAGEIIGWTVGGAALGTAIGGGMSWLADVWQEVRVAGQASAARLQVIENTLKSVAQTGGIDEATATGFAQYAAPILAADKEITTIQQLSAQGERIQKYARNYFDLQNRLAGMRTLEATVGPEQAAALTKLANNAGTIFTQPGIQQASVQAVNTGAVQAHKAISLLIQPLAYNNTEIIARYADEIMSLLNNKGIATLTDIEKNLDGVIEVASDVVNKRFGQDMTAKVFKTTQINNAIEIAKKSSMSASGVLVPVEMVARAIVPTAKNMIAAGITGGSTVSLGAAVGAGVSQLEGCYQKVEQTLGLQLDKTLLNGRYGYLYLDNTTDKQVTVSFDWVGGPATQVEILAHEHNRIWSFPGWHLKGVICSWLDGSPDLVLRRPAAGLAVGINEVMSAQLYARESAGNTTLAARNVRGFVG
jgi:hypothetical protein